jgi:hypothetical protein
MTNNHWRVVAILGGLALGFFYVAGKSGATTGIYSYSTSLYNSGISAGGNYG